MPSHTKKGPRRGAEIPDPLAPEKAQRELTPAPVAPAANDAARAAIATINTQLSEMDKVEAGLGGLEQRYAKVAYPVDTKKGMDEAVLARREIKGVRVDVEHARKAAKAPILALGRDIDDRAQKITARLLVLEEPIDDQIKVEEEKERKRKADLEARLVEIRGTPQRCIGKSAADLQQVLDALESLPLAEFAEYREQAAKAQFDATQSVQVLLQQARQAAELAALQEQQRQEAQRKAGIQRQIHDIGALLLQLPMCRTSTRVDALIYRVERLAIDDDVYQEFAAAAREKKAEVLAALLKARDEKKAAEDQRSEQERQAESLAAGAPAPTAAPSPGWSARQHQHGTVDGLPPDAARIYPDEPAPPIAAAAPITSAPAPHASTVDEDPFTAPRPAAPAGAELSISAPQRPSDAEILAVLADHYETEPTTAAAWLRTFDADAALRQLALPIA